MQIIDPGILDELTPSDVRTLVDFEDELTRVGSFELIFPTVETERYTKYFNEILYSNLLLMYWQKVYSEDRGRGRKILDELCKEGLHHSDISIEQFAQ